MHSMKLASQKHLNLQTVQVLLCAYISGRKPSAHIQHGDNRGTGKRDSLPKDRAFTERWLRPVRWLSAESNVHVEHGVHPKSTSSKLQHDHARKSATGSCKCVKG